MEEWPDPTTHLYRSQKGIPLVKLTPLQWSVWEQLSPDKTVQQIGLDLEEDLFAVRQACAHLIQLGLALPAKDRLLQGSPVGRSANLPDYPSWHILLERVWRRIQTHLRIPSRG